MFNLSNQRFALNILFPIISLNTFLARSIVMLALLITTCLITLAENCEVPIFSAPHAFNAGNRFTGLVIAGDFNKDGNPDAAVSVETPSSIAVLWGDGNGNFPTQTTLPVGVFSPAFVTDDFNSDGNPDFASASFTEGLVYVFLGNGAGGFSSSFISPADNTPISMTSGDFNADGKPDIALMSQNQQKISILSGNGLGNFQISLQIYVGAGAKTINAGDLNHDNKPDLVVTSAGSNFVTVYYGTAGGQFSSRQDINIGTRSESNSGRSLIADFNADGNQDIAAITTGSPTQIFVLLGNGQGQFSVVTSPALSGQINNGVAGDVNGDGKLDIVRSEGASNVPGKLTVYLGNGQGAFVEYASYPTHVNPYGVDIADFNKDNKPDLINADYFDAGVSILTNLGNAPKITLSIPQNIQVNATSALGAIVDYPEPNGGGTLSYSIPSGSSFSIGTTPVNYTISDTCGNVLNGSFQITVIDEPPVLSLPDPIRATTTVSSGAIVNYTTTASDVVSGTLPVTCNPSSGSTFPIGQTTVLCHATDSAGNTTSGSFIVNVFGCIGCRIPTFTDYTSFSVGSGLVHRVVVADFNKDGNDDIAATVEFDNTATILWGDGTGNFPTQTFLPVGNFSISLIDGDFNGDNNPDLAVASFSEGSVYTFLGNGAGGFSQPFISNAGNGPFEIIKADFNNDGKLDLAASDSGQEVSVLLGNGAGSFANPIQFFVGGNSNTLKVGDFNSDNKPDIVTSSSNNLSVFYGDGSGLFNTRQDIDVEEFVDHISVVADFNNDGKIDIGSVTPTGIVTFLGNGQGQFNKINSPHQGGQINWATAADINKDNKLDFIMSEGSPEYGQIAVYLGNGQGGFSFPINFPTLVNPIGIATGDFNKDGKPDITVADYFYSSVSVIINTTVTDVAATPTGSNIPIQTNNATLTFNNVTTSGVTSVTSIDPATAGDVPGGFALADLAFEVSTSATFTGSVITCFNVPNVNDPNEFANLRVLHKEGTSLVDRTSSHDFDNRKICATTTSFSPFYLSRVGNKVNPTFDRTRAFNAGSTIPIRLQMLNSSNQNISSANLVLTTRSLRRIGNNTTMSVTSPGNSNPDNNFVYNSGNYRYNLKTTGLQTGKYVLSFYAGSDRTFFYTVEFEVK